MRRVGVLPCGGYGWVSVAAGVARPFDQIRVRVRGPGEGDGSVDGYVVHAPGGDLSLGRTLFGELFEELP